MRWPLSDEADTGDPDITGLRHNPGRAPGLSPGRVGLAIVVLGCALIAWLVMPLSSWVSGVWAGFGSTRAPVAQVAVQQTDMRDMNQLIPHYTSKPPPTPAVEVAPPVVEPVMLAATVEVPPPVPQEGPKPPPVPALKPHQPKDDDAAKKRREEAKRKREAFAKSEPIFLTRKKDDKPGQTHALKSPFSLAPSETIPCETTGQISNETPGAFVAIVSRNVIDTATQSQVVIPKGAKFVMEPRTGTIFGDSRLAIEVRTLTFPGGNWLKFPSATAQDAAGTAGFTGEINRHYGRLFASIILQGVLRGGTALMTGGYGGGAGERIGSAVAQEGATEGSRQVRSQLSRTDPTITIPALYACQILLRDELVLTRAYPSVLLPGRVSQP
jgi:type IV secretory pathway VirB10-like protein